MATGGKDLRDLDAKLLYDLGYSEMVAGTQHTEEEKGAVERFEKILRDAEFEEETGMPSVAQMYPSADQL
jgi:hypothetical protein